VSEFEQLYREVILDHYKAPRNHGLLDPCDAVADGKNPLCGDEVTVTVRFGPGDVVEEVGFEGQGCAISQAATSMLTELVKGRSPSEVATLPREDLRAEGGVPKYPQSEVVVGEFGIEIVADESYGPTDADMTPQLTNIKNTAGIQAVLNPGFGQGPSVVTRNYQQLAVGLPLYQSHGVASKVGGGP